MITEIIGLLVIKKLLKSVEQQAINLEKLTDDIKEIEKIKESDDSN